jgi:ribulose-5-phosphate 4-epimerase/fuculose-1-phosphate aldolase
VLGHDETSDFQEDSDIDMLSSDDESANGLSVTEQAKDEPRFLINSALMERIKKPPSVMHTHPREAVTGALVLYKSPEWSKPVINQTNSAGDSRRSAGTETKRNKTLGEAMEVEK